MNQAPAFNNFTPFSTLTLNFLYFSSQLTSLSAVQLYVPQNLYFSVKNSVKSQAGYSNMADANARIYHEKQKLQYCLLHTLNNLFQEKNAFTRASLNEIAERLARDFPSGQFWTPLSLVFKPYHNVLTGNYNADVLIAAVESKGKRVQWYDSRKEASDIEVDSDELMGIVLNVPVRKYGGIWKGRHWIAVRKIDGVWYNLDSDLGSPDLFRNSEEVKEFLKDNIYEDAEIFLVRNGQPLPHIYHERQKSKFCLLHTLNNLFQAKDAFTRASLNEVAQELSRKDPIRGCWTPLSFVFTSHHNVFTGNYDVNVLIAALEGKGKNVEWLKGRDGAAHIDLDGEENSNGLMGIVLNVPVGNSDGTVGHWVALRKILGVWYDLNSCFGCPYRFENSSAVRNFLDYKIKNNANVLLVKNRLQ